MSISIKILEGPNKDATFEIFEGAIIGRDNQDISLKDPRASGAHAQVTQDEEGQFFLKDLDSRNGISVDGKKRKIIPLKSKTIFHIGKSVLEVVLTKKDVLEAAPKGFVPDQSWQELINNSLKDLKCKNEPKTIHTFPIPIELNITHGLQKETSWTVAYGPRSFGAIQPEFTLFEQDAPDLCFQIYPEDENLFIETQHSNKILLNDEKFTKTKLRDGDRISINNTELKVKYLYAEAD